MPRFAPSGCAALTLDHRTGERRPSTLADLRDATVLLDETPELDVQWTTVTANDVPLERREKLEYYAVLTETDKHVTFVDCPSAIEPVLAIVEVLCGSLDDFRRRPRISTLFTVASPLSLDGRLLDFHASLADYGTPIEIYTVPISGATAPVTLAGVVVQGVAELLGAVAAMQILSPGARLICGPSGAVLDMRSTSICYGALEGGLLNAAFTEVLHHLGLPVITPGSGHRRQTPGRAGRLREGVEGDRDGGRGIGPAQRGDGSDRLGQHALPATDRGRRRDRRHDPPPPRARSSSRMRRSLARRSNASG